MADATTEISGLEEGNTPIAYTVPPALIFDLLTVHGTFDGSGAAGAFLPACQIVSDAGHTVSLTSGKSVAAGDSAEVTFGPFLDDGTGTATGTGIDFDVTPQTGDWLEVIATDTGGSDNVGVFIQSTRAGGGGGIEINSLDGDLLIDTTGNGNIQLDTAGGTTAQISISSDGSNGLNLSNTGAGGLSIADSGGGGMFIHASSGLLLRMTTSAFTIQGLPVVNPGGSGIVWNNGGVLSIT